MSFKSIARFLGWSPHEPPQPFHGRIDDADYDVRLQRELWAKEAENGIDVDEEETVTFEASSCLVDPDEVFDRVQRDGLAGLIRQFLSEQSTAFEFDEALDDYRQSADPTVRFVTDAVWYHYDDCDDHMVVLSKPEWDFFQRLLLLLESDQQIVTTSTRRWSWTQLVACTSLLAFGWCIWHFGCGQHLLVFSIPFGIVSIFVSFVRNRTRSTGPYDYILVPFRTFSDLSAAHKSAAAFTKERYPRHLANRKIRSRVAEFGMRLQLYAAWLLLAPIPLFVQTFPMTETHTSVKVT